MLKLSSWWMFSDENWNILNCNSSCSINPLWSWSSILKTFSISDGVFLDRPNVAKNVFGLKESFAEIWTFWLRIFKNTNVPRKEFSVLFKMFATCVFQSLRSRALIIRKLQTTIQVVREKKWHKHVVHTFASIDGRRNIRCSKKACKCHLQ